MVPRLVAIWLRLIFLIPCFVRLTRFVTLNDDTSVAIATMTNKLARFEQRPATRIELCSVDRNHEARAANPNDYSSSLMAILRNWTNDGGLFHLPSLPFPP